MDVGTVRRIDIDDEMQHAYLDYAMSVIVSRALPDARDGLKPVQRRILNAMHAMGVRPDSEFKKSARIVGEVLGKYHPHGEMAIYDAMARMAQDFTLRSALVEGQGNFGSVDGDPPAAMRYTEARLSPLAMELLADLDKDTVDLVANFDGSLQEPTVLPAAFPNLLANGATGIAVGMATSIPPHNLGELCEALIYMLGNWTKLDRISLDDLMRFIPGPDFPTGGIILREKKREGEELATAYATGRGRISVQARAHIEEMARGRSRIIVSELPFQVNKAGLIERIADLVRTGNLEGLADLRDESDRLGMRIVIELSKNAEPEKVLAELYRRTPLQSSFSVILLALVEGEPRLLNLKQALRVYLDHRMEIVRRRSDFELVRARERSHILEGVRIALANLEEVVRLIRAARDADQAQQRLQRRFKLSDAQAKAILEMPLRRLASLERKKIDGEYREIQARVVELEGFLRSERKMRSLIAEEVAAIKAKYGDRRRTQIVETRRGRSAVTLTAADLAPAKETWVTLSSDGLLARSSTARLPRLSGRGAPQFVIGASARDTLFLFDGAGTAVAVAVHTLPETDDPDKGSPLKSTTPFPEGTQIATGIAIPPEKVGKAGSGYLLLGTRRGMLKKSDLEALSGPSARALPALKVAEGDDLIWAAVTSGKDELIMVSSDGAAIRFNEEEVRPMGLSAAGVLGMRLEAGKAHIIGYDIVRPKADLLLVSEQGEGKRTPLAQFPRQGRYGKGVVAWKSSKRLALAGALVGGAEARAILRLARGAARSLRVGDAPRRTRAAGGVRLVELGERDRVVQVQRVVSRPEFKEGGS